MRDILFRGKTTTTKKSRWMYGLLLKNEYGWQIINDKQVKYVFEYSIGEYIGIKDVKRKKIFEGDILKDTDGLTYVVVFEDQCFTLRQYFDGVVGDLGKYPGKITSEYEVVGNIYDIIEKEEKD